MAQLKYYATGRRKTAVARVWLTPGNGNVKVNGHELASYVGRKTLEMLVMQPFVLTGTTGQFDVWATTTGGGISGHAGALRHGISRALTIANPDLHTALRRSGMVTRDSRVKERKKYGRKRARRAFQWSKR
ncbi:MAG: 30S ribosomal protein S9 [Armatimonadota bacterium]